MMDFNILNRATFQETLLEFSITAQSGVTETHVNNFPENAVFCVRSAEWKYSVPGGQLDPYGWPKVPMRVSIENAMKEQIASPQSFSPPAIARDKLSTQVINTSAVSVTVLMKVSGLLVLPVA